MIPGGDYLEIIILEIIWVFLHITAVAAQKQ